MIMLRYAEIEEDSPTDARERERQLFDRSIELLTKAVAPRATATATTAR